MKNLPLLILASIGPIVAFVSALIVMRLRRGIGDAAGSSIPAGKDPFKPNSS